MIFSEPVSDGTEDPANFSIGHANVNPESAYLPVLSATLSEDGVAVDLETGSQSEVIYEL
ncbi:MAG: hypothetical protein GWN07_37680, partial [Actinobacteria bacterium]|nr:hypothetical protein [Actinomycetota bacterium]